MFEFHVLISSYLSGFGRQFSSFRFLPCHGGPHPVDEHGHEDGQGEHPCDKDKLKYFGYFLKNGFFIY